MEKMKTNCLEGDYITLPQLCLILNCGKAKAREIAEASGAVRKFGKNWRAKRTTVIEYIENNCK
jgi:hypothetical protein